MKICCFQHHQYTEITLINYDLYNYISLNIYHKKDMFEVKVTELNAFYISCQAFVYWMKSS